MQVERFASTVIIPEELRVDSTVFVRQWFGASADVRQAWYLAAAQNRTVERDTAPKVTLTLDSLLDKLGFGRDYAEHLVQPYCTCGDSADGWSTCAHVRDLGLTR